MCQRAAATHAAFAAAAAWAEADPAVIAVESAVERLRLEARKAREQAAVAMHGMLIALQVQAVFPDDFWMNVCYHSVSICRPLCHTDSSLHHLPSSIMSETLTALMH